MKTRKSEAAEKKRSGKYNCAQAVICTYCDKVGIDENTAMNIGNAFAAGMGNTEGTCGALVGAGIVIGLSTCDRVVSAQLMRKIMTDFQARNGATRCKDLKGVETGSVLRQCPDCVADAAEFLEETLENCNIDGD